VVIKEIIYFVTKLIICDIDILFSEKLIPVYFNLLILFLEKILVIWIPANSIQLVLVENSHPSKSVSSNFVDNFLG